MEISGKVIALIPKSSGTSKTGNTWEKAGFVIETDGQYPKKVAFDGFGDVIQYMEKLNIGDVVTASYNLESREWEGRWFSQISCWKVKVDQKAGVSQSVEPQTEDGGDDLPF